MIEFWLKLWQLARPYKGRFTLGVLCGVLSGMADTVVLLTIAIVAGAVFPAADQLPDKVPAWAAHYYQSVQHWIVPHTSSEFAKVWLVSLIPLVMLARGLVNYLSSYLMNWVGIRATCDLRARLFEHLLNQPLSFFSRNSTGELMSRISVDVGLLQAMIGVSMVTLISQPVNIVTMIQIPLAISLKYTLIALVTLPLCVVPVAIYNRKLRKSAVSIQTETAGLNRVVITWKRSPRRNSAPARANSSATTCGWCGRPNRPARLLSFRAPSAWPFSLS